MTTTKKKEEKDMVTVTSAPRNIDELLRLSRSVRMRLAYQLEMFRSSEQEIAFNAASNEDQCRSLCLRLLYVDKKQIEVQIDAIEDVIHKEQTRENALRKLSAEERELLGLRDPR